MKLDLSKFKQKLWPVHKVLGVVYNGPGVT